mgnify:CR=1 FL=1
MPAYDYKCLKCEHIFEQFRTIEKRNDSSLCPECGSTVVEMSFGNSSVKIGDPVHLGVKKVDDGFKEVLKNIKRNHPKGGMQLR